MMNCVKQLVFKYESIDIVRNIKCDLSETHFFFLITFTSFLFLPISLSLFFMIVC